MRPRNLLLVVLVFFFLIFHIVTVQSSELNKDARQLTINDVISKANDIKTYYVLLTAHIYQPDILEIDPNVPDEFDPNHFIAISSMVYGESGKKMRINTTLKSPVFDTEIDLLLVFDGTWLWVEQHLKKQGKDEPLSPKISAMKIRISEVSPDAEKEPFSTIYGVSGTGLFRYKDLPGTLKEILTSYKFNRINKNKSGNSKEIIFGGELDQEASRQIEATNRAKGNDTMKELSASIKSSTKYCKIWVSKKKCLVNAFSIGASDNRLYMHIKISYQSVNDKLPEGTFSYTPPTGVEVRDMTSNFLEESVKGINK